MKELLSGKYPPLYVEGKNDLHAICNLLIKSGVDVTKGSGPIELVARDSVEQVIEIIDVATKSAIGSGTPVGFIVDADISAKSRWKSVTSKLKSAGCSVTKRDLKESGVVKSVNQTKVGVWMMPYPAASSGKLEDFLRQLIPADNRVFPIARNYIANVAAIADTQERFKSKDKEKAEIYAWLAAQDQPGNSYGVAVKAGLFSCEMPLAKRFVAWVRELYSL